jgi:hypothetical protein
LQCLTFISKCCPLQPSYIRCGGSPCFTKLQSLIFVEATRKNGGSAASLVGTVPTHEANGWTLFGGVKGTLLRSHLPRLWSTSSSPTNSTSSLLRLHQFSNNGGRRYAHVTTTYNNRNRRSGGSVVLYAARPDAPSFSRRIHIYAGSGWCTALGHHYREISRPFRVSMATVRPQSSKTYLPVLQLITFHQSS